MKTLIAILLLASTAHAQVVLQPGQSATCETAGATATATGTPIVVPTATVAPTPIATATPTGVIIGPVAVPPLLLWFSTAMQGDGKVHAGSNQAWNMIVQQGILSLDLYIDGVFYPNPIAPAHTATFTLGNPNNAFFWAPTVGTHRFVMNFNDASGFRGSVVETIPVLP